MVRVISRPRRRSSAETGSRSPCGSRWCAEAAGGSNRRRDRAARARRPPGRRAATRAIRAADHPEPPDLAEASGLGQVLDDRDTPFVERKLAAVHVVEHRAVVDLDAHDQASEVEQGQGAGGEHLLDPVALGASQRARRAFRRQRARDAALLAHELDELIDPDHDVQRAVALVAGVIDADQLEVARLARRRQHRAARVSFRQQGVDDEVDVIPALFLIAVVRIDDLAARDRLHDAEREAPNLHRVPLPQRGALPDLVRHDRHPLVGLEDRGVQQRVDRHPRQLDLPGLEIVALVAHHPHPLFDPLAPLRHAFDAVKQVGHLRPDRDVFVRQKKRLTPGDLVRERGAELAGLDAPPPQLAVRTEERALVFGGAANQVRVLAARALFEISGANRLDLQRVGVRAVAGLAGRGRQPRTGDDVERDADDDQRAEERQPSPQRSLRR